jgi:hypothetical protein
VLNEFRRNNEDENWTGTVEDTMQHNVPSIAAEEL